MTTKAEIQVHCDLTEVDLGEMFQAERTGDPATSVIDVNVPTFYLDIHMKPEDMIEVFKVVQTKESWMSNEEERVQVINDAFVQFYLFCIGQDNSATNSTEDDTENKERQEDIAEMIGDAEKMFENKYRELVHSTLPPKYKNIPPKNIIFHFNNEPAVLIETFYDRVTKNEKHRNMFPYAEPIDNTNN